MPFAWIYYIARAKLCLTEKEVGRLTYLEFKQRYRAYQDTFDIELLLTLNRKTYEQARQQANSSDEWFKD